MQNDQEIINDLPINWHDMSEMPALGDVVLVKDHEGNVTKAQYDGRRFRWQWGYNMGRIVGWCYITFTRDDRVRTACGVFVSDKHCYESEPTFSHVEEDE